MANDYSKLSKEELLKVVEKLESRKKYGLVWDEERTKEQFEKESENALPVLKEVKGKEIISDPIKPINILIEGDNYHALSVLNYTHQGKIDFIYIDPPYNTGNKTWKYNNNYVEDDDNFKHSRWLSFMSKRLRLSKNLLTEDGVICVTIDNYEVHNLRHLMEEVFGNLEIVITIIEHNFRGRAKNNFALTHEYAIWGIPKGKDIITRLKEMSGDINRNLRRTGQGSRRRESPTLFYGIEVNKKTLEINSVTKPIPEGIKLPISPSNECEYIWPIDNEGVERRWYYGPTTVMKESERGNVWAKTIKNKIEIHYTKPGKYKRRKSVWTGPKYDGSTYGSELLTEIIGENNFPFPKSIYAVIDCIESGTDNKNATILDFFAGSGTVGHAVLEMNEIDNGNRKFILCTNNENNICEEITFPRLKNVIKGYSFKGKQNITLYEKKITPSTIRHFSEINKEIESIKNDNHSLFDEIKEDVKESSYRILGVKSLNGKKEGLRGNLKYFTTSFIKRPISKDSLKIRITQECTEMLCLRESIFNEVKKTVDYRIFQNDDRIMGVYYSLEHTELKSLKKDLDKLKGNKILYCFTLDPLGLDNKDFLDWEGVSLEPIPQKILDIYESINEY